MAFDFSTLVTDRTQQDVAYARQLAEKLVTGTATEAEIAEWNSFTLKGVYNHTDLNRVTAAMEALKAKLEGYGYAVPGYQRVEVPHVLPEPEPTSRLPEGYTELTYIESTGTQYVDTGIAHSSSENIVLQADVSYTVIGSAHQLMGFTGNAGNAIGLYNGSWWEATSLGSATVGTRYAIEIGVNGTSWVRTVNGKTATGTRSTYSYTSNMYLFAARDSATSPTIAYFCSCKMYGAKVLVGGTLVRDFVPCISPSGDVGLFDVVNKQFYGNSGTGVFVAGARVGVILPDGYTRLSHIESTGTQYIDTGFKPNQDSRIDMVAQLTGTVGENNMLFGTRSSGTTEFFVYYHTAGTYYGRYVSSTLQVSKTFGSKVSVSLNKNTFTLGGSSVSTTYSAFQCTTNAVLFAWNNTGTISDKSAMKLYSCQIYDNGTLVRDYIPCINPDGSVGLYDLVTAAFFGNSGTGYFIASAIPRKLPEGYTQVAYIESTGSQYINSNYTPTGTTTMKATVLQYAANANVEQAVFGHSNSGFEMGFGATNQVFLYSTASASYKSPNTVYDVVFDMTGTVSETSPYKKLIVSLDGGVEATSTAENNSKWKDGVITLFALNGKYNFTGRLYCASIYDSNNVCVRDFVPCKNSGGVIGLYDLANDVFYQNAGTGTFAAGEEVVAPVAAFATKTVVTSDDVTEYDPYTWYEFDWPTPETMAVYLMNVTVIRAIIAVMESTPSVPVDRVSLMVQEANDIEAILLDVYRQLNIMTTTFIPCGEALCGGDNL